MSQVYGPKIDILRNWANFYRRPEEIPMPREMPSATSSSAGHGDRTASSGSSENGIFRKEGEYWTVGYGKRAFRLKDTKGFAYLAHLLRHPGAEFPDRAAG
jgi:hypothetical protein